MSILTIIVIFALGFLTLYAAYKYRESQVLKFVVYVVVMVVFLIVLLSLAGVIPNNFLNRRI